jgi:hypothetical protein
MVLGPLLLISQGQLPRGVRKLEKHLPPSILEQLKGTLATHDRASILSAIYQCVDLYRDLRSNLYDSDIQLQTGTEKRVLEYYDLIAELPQKINS